MEKKQRIIYAAGAVVSMAVLFVAFWLTRFRYDKMGSDTTTRTNRWTGEVSFLTVYGWRRASEPVPLIQNSAETLREKMRVLPDSDYTQLECTAVIAKGELVVTLYNKTRWKITEMMVHVDLVQLDPLVPRISRDFIVAANSPIGWLQTGTLSVYVGSEMEPKSWPISVGNYQTEKLVWKWLKVAGYQD